MTDHTQKHIDSPEVAAWWAERRRYLEQIRKTPELRQQFRKEVALYLLRRALWCYGFFPVVIAFWLPFVLSSFNSVVIAHSLLPTVQVLVASNAAPQATTLRTLTLACLPLRSFV